MKFKIKRTSLWDDDVKPCEEAYKGKILYVDKRGFKSFEECKKSLNEDFLSKGTNHKVTKDGIERHLGYRDCWYVDINSLEDLLKFEKKYGKLIIETSYYDYETPTIEIYDYYRE